MTAARGSKDRTVIPRWRAWRATEQSKELLPLNETSRSGVELEASASSLASHIEDFKADRRLHTACDLVNTALVLGLQNHHVAEAAELIVGHPLSSAAARSVAYHLLNPEKQRPGPEVGALTASPDHYIESASRLKKIVSNEPNNAIRWVDLARVYTALGAAKQASRAMKVALAIGRPNRFILRAATRFEIHRNEFAWASRILNREPRRLEDPWILAAEVATATLSNSTSRHMRFAKRMLERQDYAPRHLSELASAVATVELSHGKTKSARKLMKFALSSPTDNSIAQAEWFIGKGLDLMEPELLDAPLGFEARATHAWRNEAWAAAVENGLLWLADQPFSYDAAAFTSYVASMGAEDYESAAYAARSGLITNPDSAMLKNNLAYAMINLGNLQKASSVLQGVSFNDLDGRETGIVTATQGLLQFRNKSIEAGRASYQDAIEGFVRQGHRFEAAMASVVYAREEVRAGTQEALQAVTAAEQRVKQAGSEAESFLARILVKSKAGTWRTASN